MTVVSHPLRSFVEQNAQVLFDNLRSYVKRSGVAAPNTLDEVTRAVLSDVIFEALRHEERFDPARSPMAWLLGIGANVIRRRQHALFERNQREPFLQDLQSARQQHASDAELWDQVADWSVASPADEVEMEGQVKEILGLVSEEDRNVIRLAILHDLSGQELGQELGVKPGAARMRLHRALQRLRQVWQQREMQ